METETDKDSNKESIKDINTPPEWGYRSNRYGRIMGGLIIVVVGGLLLANQLGVFFPTWLFTWQMALIFIGLYIGARHNFRGGGWLAPIVIGSVFMLDLLYPGMQMKQYIWPVLIITAGLFMIFNSRGHHRRYWERRYARQWGKQWSKQQHHRWEKKWQPDNSAYSSQAGTHEDYLELVCVFGEIKKNIISKTFKGGEAVTVFGGSEINLSQADIQGRVVLELTQVFGGTRLIVPPHWQIDSQLIAFLGGVEDKRSTQSNTPTDPNKTLVLQGNVVFGGLEIRSF